MVLLKKWCLENKLESSKNLPESIASVCIDSRSIDQANTLFFALPGEHCHGEDFLAHAEAAGASAAVVSKTCKATLNLPLIYVDDPVKALKDLARFHRRSFTIPVIAITGSSGKTWVKDLLYHLLASHYRTACSEDSFNSQLGVPLSILSVKPEDEIFLIEAGISKPGEMQDLATLIAPTHTLLTGIGPAHVANFSSIHDYQNEKLKLVEASSSWSLTPKSYAIPSKNLYFWDEDTKLPQVIQVQKQKTQLWGTLRFPDGQEIPFQNDCGQRYFLDNLKMASSCAYLLGVPPEKQKEVLKNYQIEALNCQLLKLPDERHLLFQSGLSHGISLERSCRQLIRYSHPLGKKTFLFSGLKKEERNPCAQKQLELAQKQQRFDQLICNSDPLKALAEKSQALATHDTLLIQSPKRLHLRDIFDALGSAQSMRPYLEINLANLAQNLELLQGSLPKKTRLMAILKANAYGTDKTIVAKFLASRGVEIFGLAHTQEALELRQAGINSSLFIIAGTAPEAPLIAKHDIEVGVSDLPFLQALEQAGASQNKQVKVHLHVDTGMSRFGCRPSEAPTLANYICQSPHLIFEGLMTHLSSADTPNEDPFTYQQLEQFAKIKASLKKQPNHTHACNSAGTLRHHSHFFSTVRLGLALWGATSKSWNPLPLKLALNLKAPIVGIHELKKGESVSYGRSWKAATDHEKIAILPIGYGDGLLRSFSGRSSFLINGQQAPMVGRICMDFMMCQVTHIPNVEIGDWAIIFGCDEHGQEQLLHPFAQDVGSSPHEIITCLGPRINRLFACEN